jgi:hypothetical protein
MSSKDRRLSRIASAKQHIDATNISLAGRSISSSEVTIEDDKNDDFVKILRINSARSKGTTPRRVLSKSPRPQLAENHMDPISALKPIGILNITLISCSDLLSPNADSGGLRGSYVTLKLSHGETAKSKCFNNNPNPVFHEVHNIYH